MNSEEQIAELNSKIKNEEREQESWALSIGKKYYELHWDSPEPALAELIRQMKESKGRVEAYKKEIDALNNMIECPSCHAMVMADSLFCTNCGFSLAKPQTTAPASFCTNCGAPLAEGFRFCTNCGTPVAKSDLGHDEGVTSASESVPATYAVNDAAAGEVAEAVDEFEEFEEFEERTMVYTMPPRKSAEKENKLNISNDGIPHKERMLVIPPENESKPASPAHQEGQAEPASAKEIFCTKCGAKLGDDEVFCINCGTRVER